MDGEMPEWAFDVHLLVDSLIRGGGGDPAMLIPDETSDLRRKMLALSLEGVNVGTVEEMSGRIECTVESIDGIVVCDQMGKTCVIIKDKGLPRSILPSLRGRGIGEIVSHPLLSKAKAVLVNDAELHETDDGFNLQLMVQDIRAAVRRAPKGRGGWRDIPY